MEKDLWNKYSSQLYWKKVDIPYEAINSKRIDICLCITEGSSYIPKTKHRKSTLLKFKITMKLQIKLPELSLGETRQSWPLWLGMWYGMRVTWHHQRLSLSRAQSRNPLKGAWLTWKWQDGEKEKDHRLIRAAPSIQTLGISEETTNCRWRAGMWSPGTGSWPVWMGWDPHSLQTLHLGKHSHSLQGATTSPDPPLGVPWPLVRTPPGLCWAPKVKTSGYL